MSTTAGQIIESFKSVINFCEKRKYICDGCPFHRKVDRWSPECMLSRFSFSDDEREQEELFTAIKEAFK